MPDVSRRSRNGAVPALRTLLSTSLGALALLAIGCGHSGNQNGTPVTTVSATNTHFVSFAVGISSVQITKDDGTVYNLLAAAETGDLARTGRLTELLNSPAIPNGTYTSAAVNLDYSAAQIYLDVNGQSVFVSPVNASGTVLSAASITVNFDKSKPLVINSGQSVRLELSFDLTASISNLNTSVSPATAQIYPMVTASLTPANSNPIRAKGAFLTADVQGGNFVMNGRPFYDLGNSLGALKVTTTSATTFDINGTTYSGTTGLGALSKQPLNQAVYVVGAFTDMTGITPVIAATQVYAANSVESSVVDHMSGTVSARSGNTLTLKGATLVSRLGAGVFVDSATVTIGSSTLVTADGRAGATLDASSISIGEFVDAIGQATINSTGTIITMDATAGEVRMSSSRLWGTINSATAGSINLNLKSINGYEPTPFNFAGTGSATANNANAATYYVNAPSTDLSSAALNSLVQIDGDANPFGSIASPTSPAFTATTVTTANNANAVLEIEWSSPGTNAPFGSGSTSTSIVPNLTGTSVHAIQQGPASLDLTKLATAPTIVASADATNFGVGGGTSSIIDNYSSISSFLTGVGGTIQAVPTAYKVRKLVAVGRYDPGANVFTASRIDSVSY